MDANSAPDVGAYESFTEYQQSKAATKTFWSVAKALNEIAERHPLCAHSYDDTQPNTRLSPIMLEFRADAERILAHKALGNNAALTEQAQRLICGEDVPNASYICRKVGLAWMKAGLTPWLYFRHRRVGRKRSWVSA